MAANDLFQCKFSLRVDENYCTVTFAYREVSTGSSTHPTEELNLAWVASIKVPLLTALGQGAIADALRVYRVAPTPAVPSIATFDESSDHGLISGETLPANLAALMMLRTNSYTGKHNGRIFLPGLSEDQSIAGRLDATWAATGPGHDLLVAVVNPISGGGFTWKPVVLMRQDAGGPITPPAWNDVVGGSWSGYIRGQRRRNARESYAP